MTNEIRIDANQKCYMPSTTVNRWLAVRLELVGGFIVLVTSLLAMAGLVTSGKVDAGLVGFVLSYALTTTQSLVSVIIKHSCPLLIRPYVAELGRSLCGRG